ncbi:hypothetical protein Ancab_023395 [Ancistrocladus abbreviatus]
MVATHRGEFWEGGQRWGGFGRQLGVFSVDFLLLLADAISAYSAWFMGSLDAGCRSLQQSYAQLMGFLLSLFVDAVAAAAPPHNPSLLR